MYVIEIRNRIEDRLVGYLKGEDGIAAAQVTARKFALPADAIPYAEAIEAECATLAFKVVPCVEV